MNTNESSLMTCDQYLMTIYPSLQHQSYNSIHGIQFRPMWYANEKSIRYYELDGVIQQYPYYDEPSLAQSMTGDWILYFPADRFCQKRIPSNLNYIALNLAIADYHRQCMPERYSFDYGRLNGL